MEYIYTWNTDTHSMKINEKDTMNLYENEERNMGGCEWMKKKRELL